MAMQQETRDLFAPGEKTSDQLHQMRMLILALESVELNFFDATPTFAIFEFLRRTVKQPDGSELPNAVLYGTPATREYPVAGTGDPNDPNSRHKALITGAGAILYWTGGADVRVF